MLAKLLVPLDGSPLAEQALGPAAAIARKAHAEIELLLVHQPSAFSDFIDAAWQASPSASERAYITSAAGELAKGASVAVSGVVAHGLVADEICNRVTATDADLIVMTSHGRTGLSRSWLGSVAHDVLRQSSVPVLMFRPVERTRMVRERRFKKILVTLDGSPLSEAILEPAADFARAFDARLILLRIVEPIPIVIPEVDLPSRELPRDEAATASAVEHASANLEMIARRLTDEGAIRVETHVVVADRIAKAILAFARNVAPSIIAMATHGRGVSRLFLGSVSDKVLRGSNTPLLLRRPSQDRDH